MRQSVSFALQTLPLALLLLASAAQAQFSWQEVRQDVTIHRDGSVTVRDERTLRASGGDDFGEAFICVLLEGPQRLVLLDDAGAVDRPGQARAFTQPCEDGSGGTEMVVRYDSRRTSGRVLFHYRLENTLSYYSDAVEWHWQVYDTDSPTARDYRLRVNVPGPMDHPYDAVVYRFGNPEQPLVQLAEDRSRLLVEFDTIPRGHGVEVRWFMDPSLFTDRGSEPGLLQILEEIASAENINVAGAPVITGLSLPERTDRNSDSVTVTGSALARAARVSAVRASVGDAINELCSGTDPFECTVYGLESGDNRITVQAVDADGRITSVTRTVRRETLLDEVRRSPLLLVLGVIPLIWLTVNVVRLLREHRDLPSDGMLYPFEPPSDLPPAAVTSLRSKPGLLADSNGFAATVMDLARRGYLEFSGSGRSFGMYVDREADRQGLLPFEDSVLRFLQGAAGLARQSDERGRRFVTNRELSRYGQRQTGFMQRWGKDVLDWTRRKLPAGDGSGKASLVTPESQRAAGRGVLYGLLASAVLVVLALLAAEPISVGLLAMAVAAFVIGLFSLGARRWKNDVAREVYGWRGFKRTLTDYTQMRDAPPDFFMLWDRYYVYAAALGVAKRFLANVTKLADERGIATDQLMGRALWLGARPGDLTSLADVASSVNSMTSSLSSALSSAGVSASSGGSSAGGGGGGGGGSSGGR